MNQYNQYRYRIHGLIVQSEIPLNGFKDYTNISPDVNIIQGEIPEKYKNMQSICSFSEEEGLLQILGIGVFYVETGNCITVSLDSEAQLEDVILFLMGSVFAILLMQRGYYPLHGCAITNSKQTIIIVGDSKAGKSTLARKSLEEGYQILSDDVTLVKIDEEGRLIAYPSYPSQKLWLDSMNQFGIQLEGKKQILKRFEKYFIEDESAFCHESKELAGIIQLTAREENEMVELVVLTGSSKIQALINNTYRYEFVVGMNKKADHFNFLKHIVNKVAVYSMTRPIKGMTVDAQFEAIEKIGGRKDEWFDLGRNRIS